MPCAAMQWIPGVFQRLLHAVPDTTDSFDFHGMILLWTPCRVPALPWSGAALPFPPCPACERIVGSAPMARRD